MNPKHFTGIQTDLNQISRHDSRANDDDAANGKGRNEKWTAAGSRRDRDHCGDGAR
jgi:hypothetical protein